MKKGPGPGRFSRGSGLNPAGGPSAPRRNSSRSGRGKKMSEGPPKENVSRRAALKIIAGSAGAAINLPVLQGSTAARPAHLCRVAVPAAPAATSAPKFFTAQEIQPLAALSETIIPADEHSPGARAARVSDYIDEIISDANEATKSLWRHGLAAVDRMAEAQNGKKFADCTPGQQTALLERVSANEENPATPEETFFVAVKKAALDGYYTSGNGIPQELKYAGNTALAGVRGGAPREHKSAENEKPKGG